LTKSTKGKRELAVTVARNASALIEELTEQGQDQAGMKKMFATCVDARMIVGALSWHLHDMTDEKRERTVQALLMLADYVQDTKNPQAIAEEVWVVETMLPYASMRSCPSLLQ
jgi:phage major head subunit gpT-like protein